MNRKEILKQAEQCICHDRQDSYGNPENNFSLIARLWSEYTGYYLDCVDVAIMMALLKIARIKAGTATEDSFIDACGYMACGGELVAIKNADK